MDQNTIESLKPFEKILHTAYHLGYANIILTDFQKIVEIYYGSPVSDLIKEHKIPASTMSCGRCRLNLLKSIAKDYFQDIKN